MKHIKRLTALGLGLTLIAIALLTGGCETTGYVTTGVYYETPIYVGPSYAYPYPYPYPYPYYPRHHYIAPPVHHPRPVIPPHRIEPPKEQRHIAPPQPPVNRPPMRQAPPQNRPEPQRPVTPPQRPTHPR